MKIVETAQSIKGAFASTRNKPAAMATYLTIQVSEYLSAGDKNYIHIVERNYMSRAE